MKTPNIVLIVLVTWCWGMANATWWKAEYDEPDGKCLVSKPDPKNKDGKPIMVWVDCDWRGGHLVTRATTTTVKPSTTTRPMVTRPPGKCLAQSDVYKYKNGEPAWVWVECDYTSGRPKPITKIPPTTAKPATSTRGPAQLSSPRPPMSPTPRPGLQQSTTARPATNRTSTLPPRSPAPGSNRPQATRPLVTQTRPAGILSTVNATISKQPTQPMQG